jgi:hypothetical protein
MGTHDRLTLTLGIVLAIVPLAVNLFLLSRHKQYLTLLGWRFRVAFAGLLLALLASIPSPIFFLALELPQSAKGDWLPLSAAWSMPLGLIAGALAIVMLAFAQGRLRWMGMASAFVSVTLLYVIMLGLSN